MQAFAPYIPIDKSRGFTAQYDKIVGAAVVVLRVTFPYTGHVGRSMATLWLNGIKNSRLHYFPQEVVAKITAMNVYCGEFVARKRLPRAV